MTYRDAYEYVTNALDEIEPLLSERQSQARLLLEFVLGVSWENVYLDFDRPLVKAQQEQLNKLIEKRKNRVPLQHLTGESYFWNSRFSVGPGVFIPRSDTEILVETILESLKSQSNTSLKVAELGAGSGNIGLSVLQDTHIPTQWYGFELNPQSLPYLKNNVRRLLPLHQNYLIKKGDFFDLCDQEAPFDILVSNPPYMSQTEYLELTPEVQEDPHLALIADNDGLEYYQRLIQKAREILSPSGMCFFEIGDGQAADVKDFFVKNQFHSIKVISDYHKTDRVIVGVL